MDSTDSRIERFWKSYVAVLKQFRIPDRAIPWYQRHIHGFIHDHPTIRLRSHTAESVQAWLEKLGRNTTIQDWQFRQKVDA